MSECAKCNGWGVDDVTGFACPSCPTVKQSLTVEPVSNPDDLTAAMQADADIERIKHERDQAVEALKLWREYYRANATSLEGRTLYDRAFKATYDTLASIEGAGHE